MRLRNTLIGLAALAVALLGGLWLFPRQSPVTPDALQQHCTQRQRVALDGAEVRLEEGTTQEEFEAGLLAICECVGRKAARQLAEEDVMAIVRKQSTPAIEAKLTMIYKQCT